MSKAPIVISTYRDGGSIGITVNDANGEPVNQFFINNKTGSSLRGVLYAGNPSSPQGIVQNIQMLSYVASVASVAVTEEFTTNKNEVDALNAFVAAATARIDTK